MGHDPVDELRAMSTWAEQSRFSGLLFLNRAWIEGLGGSGKVEEVLRRYDQNPPYRILKELIQILYLKKVFLYPELLS